MVSLTVRHPRLRSPAGSCPTSADSRCPGKCCASRIRDIRARGVLESHLKTGARSDSSIALAVLLAELPRGRACPVCSQLNRAGQRGGSGSSVPRPAVCVRASSHTSSNNGKKEVSTTTTQKAMRGPWTCGASKMGRNKRREGGGKNLGPSLIGEGHTQVEREEDNYPLPHP